MQTNSQGEIGRTVEEIQELLRINPDLDLTMVQCVNASQHNQAVVENYSDLSLLKDWTEKLENPHWHELKQQQWFMPKEFLDLDIESLLLATADSPEETARITEELAEYRKRHLLNMLRYLCWLSITLKENQVVLGVGRGSSVASFCLFKLGLHKINSLVWDLNISEFLK